MRLLVCGTRMKKPNYKDIVWHELSEKLLEDNLQIIEGCCKESADQYTEEWATYVIKELGRPHKFLEIAHFPSNPGNYLKRNIEMVELCDEVLAFWDGFSYGTAHVIANAIMRNKPVKVIKLER